MTMLFFETCNDEGLPELIFSSCAMAIWVRTFSKGLMLNCEYLSSVFKLSASALTSSRRTELFSSFEVPSKSSRMASSYYCG